MASPYHALFGIEDLRVGLVELRGAYNILKARLFIDEVVVLQILPSFAPTVEIAFVRAVRSPYEFEEEQQPGWIRMGFIPDQTDGPVMGEVVELKTMPVFSSLTHVDFTKRKDNITLDGVGYRLRYETPAIEASLGFLNPEDDNLLSLVDEVAKAAAVFRSPIAKSFLSSWKPYRKG